MSRQDRRFGGAKSASLASLTLRVGVLCLAVGAARAGTVDIALSPVGDAGNVADSRTGFGAVPYGYNIGTYDVTMGQYTSFLNAVAASDPYGLYHTQMATATPTYGILRTSATAGYSYALRSAASANVPVTFVSWGDACRFVNWLQNGEPTGLGEVAGSTETGSYALNGSTGSAALMAVTRSTTATWVLPTDNEWYKAAYYKSGGTNAGYWVFPTQNDNPPSNVLSSTGTNNANYNAISSLTDPVNLLTPAGAFTASPGPYGTYDQGGNLWQWEETLVFGGQYREIRGGSFASDYALMQSNQFSGGPMETPGISVGFRVAYVPEPSSFVVLITAAAFCFSCLRVIRLHRRGKP